MRICAVIPDLRAGGAQRVLVTLAAEWKAAGHEVTILTLDAPIADFFATPPGVARIAAGGITASDSLGAAIRNNWTRIRALRREIARLAPDLVVSFLDKMNVLAILATLGRSRNTVVSERIYPPLHSIGPLWSALRRATYPVAGAVVMQTELGRRWAAQIVSADRVAVIANPLARTFLGVEPSPAATRPHVISAVGRLTHQKGFDLLVAAFAASQAPALGWRLNIVGEGEARAHLEAQVLQCGMENAIHFTGNASDVRSHLLESAIFVLPSRAEGFPNVLIEAMACGCAVIAADCLTGPADIIRPGENGLLIEPESTAAITQTLNQLISSPTDRARLAEAAVRSGVRYGPAAISSQWLRLFEQLGAASPGAAATRLS